MDAFYKGYRSDVIVEVNDKRYKIYITSMIRLQQDFGLHGKLVMLKGEILLGCAVYSKLLTNLSLCTTIIPYGIISLKWTNKEGTKWTGKQRNSGRRSITLSSSFAACMRHGQKSMRSATMRCLYFTRYAITVSARKSKSATAISCRGKL